MKECREGRAGTKTHRLRKDLVAAARRVVHDLIHLILCRVRFHYRVQRPT